MQEPAVRHLVDRAELHDLVLRYAAGVDRRDWEQVRSCFVPDLKVVDWGDTPFADREEMLEYIKGVAFFRTTMHMMGNQFIEIDGDTAAVDTLAMIAHELERPDGRPLYLDMSGSRYFEKCSRRGGEWVIHRRGGEPAWAPTGVRGLTSDEPAVRLLLDRAEIHDVLLHFALGVDLRDWDRVRRVFADGFEVHDGSEAFTDLDSLIDHLRGVEQLASTTHFLGTHLIEIDGDDAVSQTYVMVTRRDEPEDERRWGQRTALVSSHRDRLVRERGAWKIAERGPQVTSIPTGAGELSTSDDPTVQRLLDRASIHDVIACAAVGTDRRDDDMLRSCFTDDCVATLDEQPVTGHADLVAEIHRLSDGHCSTYHFLGNQMIDLRDDEADVTTYAYVIHRDADDAQGSAWGRGARRLVDRLRKVDGAWRIATRLVTTNHVGAGAQT